MTTGALIFAFNNEKIDYVSLAAWNAKNIQRHLGIGTAVVTDADTVPDAFEHVIKIDPDMTNTESRYFEDIKTSVTWHNRNRMDAFEVSPWQKTILLDADYVVASNSLLPTLECKQDFLCYKDAYDVSHVTDFSGLNSFGSMCLPMWWATVVVFERSRKAKMIFDCMKMIKQHWSHYRNLYGIQKKTYRNDFALSIALGIVSGQTWRAESLSGSMASVMPEHELTQLDTDHYQIRYQNRDNQPRTISWKNMDFHAMGKSHLEAIIASH